MLDNPDLKVLSRYVRSYLGGLKSLCVEVEREEWKYHDGGKGETIVFLHGMTGSKTQWRSLMHEYLPNYRVIALDVPGLCITQPFRNRKHSLRQLGLWLGRVLDRLLAGNVHLVASSLGCALAAYYAAHHPDRIKSLTMLNFPALLATPQRKLDQVLSQFIANFEVDTTEELQAMYRRAYFMAPSMPRFVLNYNLRELQQNRATINQVLKELVESSPVMNAGLRQIRVPTLVLHGDSDQLTEPCDAAFWRLQIPQADFFVLPECGHMPHIEKPDEVLYHHKALLRAVRNGEKVTKIIPEDTSQYGIIE